MKHHLLLGLILGLLATARIGGQELFNVEFNTSANTVKITATGQNPAPLAPVETFSVNVSLLDGITLINFFSNTSPTVPNTSNTILGAAIPSTLTVYKENAPGAFAAQGSFDRMIISDLGLQNVSGIGNDPSDVQNPQSSGKSLNLFISTNQNDPTELRFTRPTDTSLPSVTINFPPNLTLSPGSGPYYVYAGQRNVFFGNYRQKDETGEPFGPDIFYTSFLGTYTISVVPEPSTYAAIAGGLGLVAAVLHRRRQRARATAA